MTSSNPAYTNTTDALEGVPAAAILAQEILRGGYDSAMPIVHKDHVKSVVFWLRRLHYKARGTLPMIVAADEADRKLIEEFRAKRKGFLVYHNMINNPGRIQVLDLRTKSADLLRKETRIVPARKKTSRSQRETKADIEIISRHMIARMNPKAFLQALVRKGLASPVDCGKGHGVRLNRQEFKAREQMCLSFMMTHERPGMEDPLMEVIAQHIYKGRSPYFSKTFLREARATTAGWLR